MFHASPGFRHDGDIESSGSGDGAADARHDNHGDVVEGDVGGGFRDEHEGFVEAEEVAFVCFDAAFDAGLLVVRDEVFGGRDDFFAGEAAEYLGYDGMLGRFVAGLEFVFVFVFEEFTGGFVRGCFLNLGEEGFTRSC